jgi:DNA polymerase-3 subunit epsilon/oligoribonuclease
VKGIFLDIETNGLDPYLHSPLEISLFIYELHTMECVCSYTTFVYCSESEWLIHSDPKALLVNGITYEQVKRGKSIDCIAEELMALFISYKIDRRDSVFICQNPSFDRSFFNQIIPVETQNELGIPYHWLDLASMYWIKRLVPQKINGRIVTYHPSITRPPCSKDAIAQGLGLPPEQIPHRAFNGVIHLIDCYKALLEI